MLRSVLSGGFGFAEAAVYIVSCLVVIFFTLPIHEYAHGWAAIKLGDNTPKWQGRNTLNPFAHIDYLGALAILLVGYGWAKPVQVNALNFKNPKRDMALTALAGPVSNLLLALICSFFYALVTFIVQSTQIIFLYYISSREVYWPKVHLVASS